MTKIFFLIILPFCFSTQEYSGVNYKPRSLTNAQQWALGVSGVLASRNHMKFDSLAGEDRNIYAIQHEKKLLKEWWNIENKKDLLKDLEWLKNEGHSAEFNKFKKLLVSKQWQTNLKEKLENKDPEFKYKIAVVRKYQDFLDNKSLYGWDVARYICLCRWGYLCGYLTEEDAWEKIMPAARFAQKTFDSWENLGKNYLIGREFWSPQNDGRYIYEDTYMRLLEAPESPWKKLPWNLSLDEEK